MLMQPISSCSKAVEEGYEEKMFGKVARIISFSIMTMRSHILYNIIITVIMLEFIVKNQKSVVLS